MPWKRKRRRRWAAPWWVGVSLLVIALLFVLGVFVADMANDMAPLGAP
jgi:hypothetical protein